MFFMSLLICKSGSERAYQKLCRLQHDFLKPLFLYGGDSGGGTKIKEIKKDAEYYLSP